MKILVLGVALTSSAVSAADAALLDFSYNFPEAGSSCPCSDRGGSRHTREVSGIQSFTVNGAAKPSATNIRSSDSLFLGSGSAPAITLDKSFIDLLITDQYGIQIFGFGQNTQFAHQFGAPVVGGAALFGGPSTFVLFHPQNFSRSPEGALSLSEPASWASTLAAFGLAGGAMRARRPAIRFARSHYKAAGQIARGHPFQHRQ